MAPPLPTSDSDLVELARGGRDDAFAALYERYFPPVFDFLTRLLHDRQEAADVAQDTFIRAMERLGGLEKPESFKSWLFTIAHRTGLNRLERSRRSVAVAAVAGDDDRGLNPLLTIVDEDRYGDPESVAEAQAVASYVWEAAVGLDPRTYAVLDLHVRHGLGSAEIAEVLGVTKGNAYTMVNRMKKSVAESLGTYLLARKGSRDCEDLAAILAGTSLPPMTPEIRRAVDKHVKECEVCESNRRALLVPLRIFAGFALVPPLPGVKEAIWAAVSAAGAAGAGEGTSGAGGGAGGPAGPGGIAAGSAVGAAAVAGTSGGAGGTGSTGAGGAGTSASSVGAGVAGSATGGTASGSASAAQGAAAASVAAGGAAGSGPGAAVPVAAGAAPSGSGAATGASPATAALLPWWQTTAAKVAAAVLLAAGSIGGLSWAMFGGGDDAPVEVLSAGVTQPDGGGDGAAGGDAVTTTTVAPTTATVPPTTTATTLPPSTAITTPSTTATTTPGSGGGGATPPAAADDSVTMDEDGTITIDILGNDVAVDASTVSVLSPPAGATVLVDADSGAIIFTPPRNASGTFTFRYRVEGTASGQVEAGVTVRVNPVNDAPVARNDTAVGAEDTILEIDVLANDTDVDDDVADLRIEVVGSPQFGSAVVTGRVVRYIPGPNYFGTDSLAYRVCDPAGACAVGTVAITITPVNDAPIVPGPGTLILSEESSVEFDPLAGATDVEGQTLFLQSFDATSVQGGTITRGSLIYTPKADFFGSDSFSYVVSDGESSTTVTVNLVVMNVNDAPRGAAPTATTLEDTPVSFDPLDGFTDPDGDALSAVLPPLPFTTPMGGTVAAGPGGTLVYTPAPDWFGTDTFDFAVSDGALIAPASKGFNVTPVNDPPKVEVVWEIDGKPIDGVNENVEIGTRVGVVKVTDVDGGPPSFAVSGGFEGVLDVDEVGAIFVVGALDFETAPELSGSIEVSDGVDTNVVDASLKVFDVDEPPVVEKGVVFLVEDDVDPGTFIGLVPASDPEGEALKYGDVKVVPVVASDPFVVKVGKDGEIVVSPPEKWNPAGYTVTVQVFDPAGNTAEAVFSIEIVDGTPPVVFEAWRENEDPTFEETGPAGEACELGPTTVFLGAYVEDAWTGVAAVDAHWELSAEGQPPVTGVEPLDLVVEEAAEVRARPKVIPGNGRYEGTLGFPFGSVPEDAKGIVTVHIVATDVAGNAGPRVDVGAFTLVSCAGNRPQETPPS